MSVPCFVFVGRPVRVFIPLALHPAQGAAQAVTSTVKAPETYSKSALLEIYAQKTEAPWVKRASSRKYSVRRHGRAAPCSHTAALPAAPRRAAPRRRRAALRFPCPPPLHGFHTRTGADGGGALQGASPGVVDLDGQRARRGGRACLTWRLPAPGSSDFATCTHTCPLRKFPCWWVN